MDEIFSCMENNTDSQFTLPDLRAAVTGKIPDDNTQTKRMSSSP